MADLAFAQARYQHLHQMITRYAPAVFNKENRHLLDVGCGRGDLLRVAQAVGWEITGIELSPLAVQQANALLGNSHVKEGDLQSLVLPQGTYSVVTSYHVIEHLLDPVANLVALRQLLQPGGIAFIETPNIDSLGARVRGKRWSHIIPPEHINYFNPDSLSYALKQSGFERYQVFTSTPPLIESIQDWPPILKAIATQVYNLAPQFNLGAALQAIAFQD
jgi:2-polyprenyl-3-methyl-5-hydroxy-6-metoxy-1,4-benzoquinol methylase